MNNDTQTTPTTEAQTETTTTEKVHVSQEQILEALKTTGPADAVAVAAFLQAPYNQVRRPMQKLRAAGKLNVETIERKSVYSLPQAA